MIRNCVLFKETVIRRNAELAHIIADKNVEGSAGSDADGTLQLPHRIGQREVWYKPCKGEETPPCRFPP